MSDMNLRKVSSLQSSNNKKKKKVLLLACADES